MAKIDYKYNEGESLKEIQSYVDATYEQHYSRNKFQATEFLIKLLTVIPNLLASFCKNFFSPGVNDDLKTMSDLGL